MFVCQMRARRLLGILLIVTIVGCDVTDGVRSQNASVESLDHDQITELLRKVAKYETGRQAPIEEQGGSWRLCTFYAGTLSAYEATAESYYRSLAHRWGEAHEWTFPEERRRHADVQCMGQVFLELYLEDGMPKMLANVKETFDDIRRDPRPGHEMWSWADALFMAPPVWTRLGAAASSRAYFDFMSKRFWEASGPLFDSEHGLYYRDERFIDRETTNGAPVFWSRGNGWVLAGIARLLQYLPDDHPSHDRFVERFQTIAAAVAPLQGDDGLWRSSLLDPTEYPSPETSGTALFTYAMAWGINEGILSREVFLPVVLEGWNGLSNNVNDDGRLGWVQDVGSRPGPVAEEGTGAYAVGALLMAGGEILRMLS